MRKQLLKECLNKIINNVNLNEYTVIVTADHGNCEVMINKDETINTQHTTNPVPFIVLDKNIELKNGKLGDIAVTMLDIMNIDIPNEMTGNSLVVTK